MFLLRVLLDTFINDCRPLPECKFRGCEVIRSLRGVLRGGFLDELACDKPLSRFAALAEGAPFGFGPLVNPASRVFNGLLPKGGEAGG